MGDTTDKVFESSPELFEYPVVVVECTFLWDEHEEAAGPSGHMHWKSIKRVAEQHINTTFVLIHFSMRYSLDDIFNFFKDMAGGCPKNVYPWITAVK